MISYILPKDWATNPECRKRYQKWLQDPTTQDVFRTMEMCTRAQLIQPNDSDAGSIGLNCGYTIGSQKVLDDMRCLDAVQRQVPVREDFQTPPTE